MNFKTLDLNLLRVLDALLSEGSTIAAGQKIGLSQPAVSAALGRLRHALGDPLFVRSGQGLEPTDFARSIAGQLSDMFGRLEHMLEPAQFDPADAQDRFVIATSDFFSVHLMPRLARIVSAEAPNVQISVLELSAGNYFTELEEGRADIALVPDRGLPEFVLTQPLFTTPPTIIAREGNRRLAAAGIGPDDAISLDLFCDLPQAVYSVTGNAPGIADHALAKLGRKRRVAMTLPTLSAVLYTVAQSDLIAVLPRHFVEGQAGRFDLMFHAPPIDIPPAVLVMGWHRRSNENPAHLWLRGRIAAALETED